MKERAVHHLSCTELALFSTDAAAVFDERYRPLFRGIIPEERVHVIPFPCHPVERRSRSRARRKLGVPMDAELVFSYGSLRRYRPVIEAVQRLMEERGKLVYLLMSGDLRTYTELKKSLSGDASFHVLFGRPPHWGPL